MIYNCEGENSQDIVTNFNATSKGRVPASLPSVTAILALDKTIDSSLIQREISRRMASYAIRQDNTLQQKLQLACFPGTIPTQEEKDQVQNLALKLPMEADIEFPPCDTSLASGLPQFLHDDGDSAVDCATLIFFSSHRKYGNFKGDPESLDDLLEQTVASRNAVFTSIVNDVRAKRRLEAVALDIARGRSTFAEHGVLNRVGPIFAKVVELLCDGQGDMEVFNNILAKEAIFVHPWVGAPKNVQDAFVERLDGGDAAWQTFQNDRMIGEFRINHVYRASDKPNRHGYCMSNPNKNLGSWASFSGF